MNRLTARKCRINVFNIFAAFIPRTMIQKPLTLLVLSLLVLMVASPQGFGQGTEGKPKKPKKVSKELYKEEQEPEDSIRRWELGLNFGAYFANKYSANFYNGSPGNINNVNYVLSNKYWYEDIKRALNATYAVVVGPESYQMNMHYQVSFMGGLFLRFNFDRKNGLFLQSNYTQLNASDYVVMEVDPKTYLTQPDLRLIPIIGREGRVMIDLAYQRSFPLKSKINLFLQAGLTMCYTQVLKSFIDVEGVQYNLINIYGDQFYVPNSPVQTININQNKFGFGACFGAGAGIPLTYMFGIEPGVYCQYYPTNLENYPLFRPSFGAYLRIMMYFGQQEE